MFKGQFSHAKHLTETATCGDLRQCSIFKEESPYYPVCMVISHVFSGSNFGCLIGRHCNVFDGIQMKYYAQFAESCGYPVEYRATELVH